MKNVLIGIQAVVMEVLLIVLVFVPLLVVKGILLVLTRQMSDIGNKYGIAGSYRNLRVGRAVGDDGGVLSVGYPMGCRGSRRTNPSG